MIQRLFNLGDVLAAPSLCTENDGTSDFTEDAKLWAAKLEVFQRALFALVKDFTELIIEHTKDTKDTWAKQFHAQYLAASSGIHKIPDLYSPATPVGIGLGFRHRDLHLGGRAYCMLLNECAQHTVNNGSRAIAALWGAEYYLEEGMVTLLLRLQGLSNAAQEQTRLPVGCEERVHPAATNACVLQIAIEALVTCTRERTDTYGSAVGCDPYARIRLLRRETLDSQGPP